MDLGITIEDGAVRLKDNKQAVALLKDLYEVFEIQEKRMSKEEIELAWELQSEGIIMRSLGYPSFKISPAGARVYEYIEQKA